MWLRKDHSDSWLDTLELISKNGFVSLDSDLKEKITTKGYCLGAIYKTDPDENMPSFMITAWDCKTKLSVVCEKEPTKFHPPNTEKPNFPCIPDKQNLRKKREDRASTLGPNFNAKSIFRSTFNNKANPSEPNGPKIPTSTGVYGSFETTSNTGTDVTSGIGNFSKLQ